MPYYPPPATGGGTGDMDAATYDPQNIADDAFDRANHTGTQTAATISDFDTEVSNNTDVAANTTARHDAVTVTDSSEIDFTLTGQDISATIKTGSIDETKLDVSTNASLDLADSAVQDLSDLGITATASELNTLDGITASTAELNILDGVTATAAELNALDGITSTVTELNYTDGVTSAIQTQIDGKVPTTRTVNGHALSGNVTVSADDVLPTQTGNSGKFLTTNGTTSSWGTPSGGGSGDVVGPSSSTNNAVALFDGTTGKLLKDSTKTLPTGTIVGTSDTQTLTGKTLDGGILSNPSMASGFAFFLDQSGNEILQLTRSSSSAANYTNIKSSDAGQPVTVNAAGSDTNIGINFVPKGTGVVQANGVNVATISDTQLLTNKDLSSGTNTFPTFNQSTTGSAATLTTSRTIGTLTGDVTSAGSSFNGSANNTNSTTVTKINGVSLAGLATGILKNTTTTGVPSIAVAADFPTLNQNTSGSAATLTTARTVRTNLASTSTASFDGSANITPGVTGTLPLGNGGTGGTSAATAAANLVVEMGKLLFPVGAIYAATVSTNPNTLLGFGTWTAYGAGRVMVGKAASGTFATGGATGGEETHTLTIAEMPSHDHSNSYGNTLGTGAVIAAAGNTLGTNNSSFINNTGGDGAHNNLQPYIVTYLWERTA